MIDSINLQNHQVVSNKKTKFNVISKHDSNYPLRRRNSKTYIFLYKKTSVINDNQFFWVLNALLCFLVNFKNNWKRRNMGGERELFCKRDAQKEEELSKMIFQQKEERNNNFYYFLWGLYLSLQWNILC